MVAAIFLGSAYDVLCEHLSKSRADATSAKDPISILDEWNYDPAFPGRRAEIFQEIKRRADISWSLFLADKKLVAEMCAPSQTSAEVWCETVFSQFCLKARERLGKIMKQCGQKHLIIALDECTELGIPNPSNDINSTPIPPKPTPHAVVGKMSLPAFRRTIKAGDGYDSDEEGYIWFTIMDTNSNVFDIVPSAPFASSYRTRIRGMISLPPWLYVDFNQMVEAGSVATKKAGDAQMISHLQQYGRPVCNSSSVM